jgi:methylenetetrahydrofolate dehydrogenase (NADP+)/methenyltetrahydrofolate cyclohydrolase
MKILDGKTIALELQQKLKLEVTEFTKNYFQPGLAVILVGNNEASKIYVSKKREACAIVGIYSELHTDITNQCDLIKKLNLLNNSHNIHGILVQLPLPQDFDEDEIFDKILVEKDVDVFNSYNIGLLVKGKPRFLPCTPHAIQILLNKNGLSVKGKHIVIVNRSHVVGRPLSSMLIQDNDEYANATVTVCHDNTPSSSLVRICRDADIIVVAVGIPGFLKFDMVRPGQTIIDVGTTRVNKKILGDVEPAVYNIVDYCSMSIGGVGPLTVHCLLENTFLAAKALI